MSAPARVRLEGLASWRHDLVGCLWTSAATILDFYDVPALETLGAAWTFRHCPQDVRREEYYYPCPEGTSLYEAIAPYHPIRSVWHVPADAEEGWQQVRDQVADGTPVVVAVDNFYLPFRPAYQDVHTNHLSIVYGYDEQAGTVRVLDAVPPRFDGDIRIDELTAARNSANPELHERDMFFTNRPIANRWLEIELDAAAFPPFTLDTVRSTLRRNLQGFYAAPSEVEYLGIQGEQEYLASQASWLDKGEDIRDGLFLAAGAALANTALHAEWLALAGRQFYQPRLAELGRQVDRVAHHWSTIRIIANLVRTGEVSADRLRRRSERLVADHHQVLEEMADVLRTL